jgi:release factor glutamine methyltransferase
MSISITPFINKLAQALEAIYPPQTAYTNAWFLIEKLFQKTQTQLIAASSLALSLQQKELLKGWLEDLLINHKPLQYILGSVPFLNTLITVQPPTLIPRPETEEWCAFLIETIKNSPSYPQTIVDLCTGSGCIAIALAKAFKDTHIYATDISEKALELARYNAHSNNVKNITFYHADLYNAFKKEQRFDLIVANPPYIDPCEWKNLAVNITHWEDKKALCASEHGVALIKKIIQQAPSFLLSKKENYPQLWIEIGYDQGKTIKNIFEKNGFYNVKILKDSSGKDRVVQGYKQ